jgi:hypothetical protein
MRRRSTVRKSVTTTVGAVGSAPFIVASPLTQKNVSLTKRSTTVLQFDNNTVNTIRLYWMFICFCYVTKANKPLHLYLYPLT